MMTMRGARGGHSAAFAVRKRSGLELCCCLNLMLVVHKAILWYCVVLLAVHVAVLRDCIVLQMLVVLPPRIQLTNVLVRPRVLLGA